MKTSIKILPKSRINLTVELSDEEMVKYYDRAFERLAPSVKVKGFRPGKAPKNIIENMLGKTAVKAEAIELAIQDSCISGLKENNKVSVESPKIDIKQDEEGLVYDAEVDVWPEIEVGEYEKLKVKKPVVEEVKEKEIKQIFEYLQKQKATTKEVDRQAKMGDWVTIDFEGKLNGVVQENMVSKNHPVILGSGSLIPGFEDEIVGMKKDEEKTFEIKFPKDYHEKSIAGKKTEFKVKLHLVKEMEMPEVDDKFAKDFGHDDVVKLREAIEKDLSKEKEAKNKQMIEGLVIDKVLTVTKTEIPEALVEQDLDRIMHQLEHEAKNYGLTLEQYLLSMKKTLEEVRKGWREQAEKNVKIGLMLGEVARRENLDKEAKDIAQQAVGKLMEKIVG